MLGNTTPRESQACYGYYLFLTLFTAYVVAAVTNLGESWSTTRPRKVRCKSRQISCARAYQSHAITRLGQSPLRMHAHVFFPRGTTRSFLSSTSRGTRCGRSIMKSLHRSNDRYIVQRRARQTETLHSAYVAAAERRIMKS